MAELLCLPPLEFCFAIRFVFIDISVDLSNLSYLHDGHLQIGSLPGFPSGKGQMDLFWQVFAEKPSYVGAGVFFVVVLECMLIYSIH